MAELEGVFVYPSKGLEEQGHIPDAWYFTPNTPHHSPDKGPFSPAFEGKRPVQKQQMIYACLNELIASGELHAVSMQTYTPSQWQSQEKLGFPGF